MATASAAAAGVSPAFKISREQLLLRRVFPLTFIQIDGVQPPVLGPESGASDAMKLINRWFPWIDEKLVEPKFDGACQHLGIASNRPTFIKDYHVLALCRAVDYVLQPDFVGVIRAVAGTVSPVPPPTPK